MKSLRKYFSPEVLQEVLLSVVRRFPYTFGWLSVLVVWLVVLVICEFKNVTLIESVNWALTEGVLLSLATALWCEYLRVKSRGAVVQLIVAVPIILDFVWLMIHGGVSGDAEYVGRAAVFTALIVAIVFLPAAPGLSRSRLWCYTLNQIGALAASWLLGIVLAISLGIMYGTLSVLFGFDSWKTFVIAQIVISFYFSSIFYLYKAPLRSDIENLGELPGTSPVAAFCKNVMLPAVAVYTLILYIYGAKILFTWSLPKASISMMVAGLLCVSLIMLYGVRRYSFTPEASAKSKRIAQLVSKALPIVLLPLVVLMTVGVVYRIGEYGLTVSRLYVVVFTAWAYAVLIYLSVKNNGNLNAVAASFAVVFVLVSVIPGLNLTSATYWSVRSEVIKSLRGAGVEEFPIPMQQLREIIAQMPPTEAENLGSRVMYLASGHDSSLIDDIVSPEGKVYSLQIRPDKSDTVIVEIREREYSGLIPIPAGYSSFESFYNEKIELEVNVDSIFAADNAKMNQTVFLEENDSTGIVITSITCSSDESGPRFKGYRFKK